jgi:hypothetical protein
VIFSFDDGSNFYQISFTGGNDSQSLEDQNIFYDFLASFQLLKPITGSTQQTFIKPLTGKTQQTAPPSKPSSVAPTPSPTPMPMPPPASQTTTVTTSAGTGTTQELLPGYRSFSSLSYLFTMQYPKGWYYGQTTNTDTSVLRRYDFGTKPGDQQPGVVDLDIVSGGVPSGTTYTVGDKMLVMTSSGGTTFYYYKGKTGRVYRVSGPAGMDSALRNMMETLQEQ